MPQPSKIQDSLRKDSIEKVSSLSQKSYTHIFSGHLLAKKNREEIPYVAPTQVWPAFVLLLPVILLVYLRVVYNKKVIPVFKSFFSLHAARQLEREDYRLSRRTSVILSFVFLVSLAFFLFQFNNHYPLLRMKGTPFAQFSLILAFLITMYLLKFFVNIILGFIMNAANEMYEYNFNIFLGNQGIGLFLLPLVICIQYLRYDVFPMIVGGFVVLVLFYLLRLLKGIQIGMESKGFSVFHLFLYLCGLEILPLIVLITFLIRLNMVLNG